MFTICTTILILKDKVNEDTLLFTIMADVVLIAVITFVVAAVIGSSLS